MLSENFWLLRKPNTTPRLHVERMSHTHTLLDYFTCAAVQLIIIIHVREQRKKLSGYGNMLSFIITLTGSNNLLPLLLWQWYWNFHSQDHGDRQQNDGGKDQTFDILVLASVLRYFGSTLSTQSAAAKAATSTSEEDSQQEAKGYHHRHWNKPRHKLEGEGRRRRRCVNLPFLNSTPRYRLQKTTVFSVPTFTC